MLSNSITLVDSAAGNQIYDLISRDGMDSTRVLTTSQARDKARLVIKQTLSETTGKPSRHLVKVSRVFADAAGEYNQACSAHLVITRHIDADDANVDDLVDQLASFFDSANIAEILRGGN